MSQSSSSEYDEDYSTDESFICKYEEYLRAMGFAIGAKINCGSFAKVRYAERRHKRTVEKMAVKIVNKAEASPVFLHKFLPRERRIWPMLKHRGIIEVKKIVEFPQRLYFFMELAPFGSVIDYIQDYGAVDEELGLRWGKTLCQALRYCHRKGVAHRDVKCDNMLITDNYDIKLGDFGFCCMAFDPKKKPKKGYSDTYCGSVAYVAPEVLMGTPYDPIAADVWSAGVCIYVILNNSMPFDDSNFSKLHKAQLSRNWYFMPDVEMKLSNAVKRLLKKMLDPRPVERITMEQVLSSSWMRR